MVEAASLLEGGRSSSTRIKKLKAFRYAYIFLPSGYVTENPFAGTQQLIRLATFVMDIQVQYAPPFILHSSSY